MYEVIKLYWDICIFKKGPQDVPYTSFIFWLSIAMYAVVGLLVFHLSDNWLNAVLQVAVEILLVTGFCGAMLILSNKAERFYQTASALLGTDTVISFLALPALSVMITGRMSNFPYYVIGGLVIWHWLVTGHIFSKALSKSFVFGLTLAMLFFLGSYQLLAILFM